MRFKSIASVLLCLSFAVTLVAQEGAADPIIGVWYGDFGPNPRDRTQVRFTFKWDGKTLIGNVTTGDEPINLENLMFDPKTGALHFEVTVARRGAADIHYIGDGKVEKDA